MKTLLFTVSIFCVGCAPRAPIDRAAVLNKSMSKQIASLRRFDQFAGVEDEQSQLADASGQLAGDIGLVRGCLKHRGGIQNPICRADWNETDTRVTWIHASADRAAADVAQSVKASNRTKRKARKAFTVIQAKAEQARTTLDQGGLLVRRARPTLNPTWPRPAMSVTLGEKSQLNSQPPGCASASRSGGIDQNDRPCPLP